MKKLIFLFCLFSQAASANDGSFYASGNTLMPLKETTIRLKKEILNLDRRGDWMQVDIYFEFFNPGPEKELTVGFVTPPAVGDITDAEANHPQIRNFMVMSGNSLLSYKVAKLEETGFKLNEKLADGFDFVYHFKLKFPKGITIIRHSYQYRGGASVEAKNEFYYRLTTGTTWANSAIEDFELNISMGDDCYFSVPASFGGAESNWVVAGVGRMGNVATFNPYGEEGGGKKLRMVYLRNGKLQLRQPNFKPQNDLAINVFQLHNEVHLWCDKTVKNDFEGFTEFLWGDSTELAVSKLSDNELRLYRNLNFARMGYGFKDETLRKAYSKYTWYIPDPELKPGNVPDYYVSKELMKLINDEEKRRKVKPDTHD